MSNELFDQYSIIDKPYLLLYSTPMNQPVLFPPIEKWNTLQSFIDAFSNLPLSTGQRLILTGGGTLATALHALLTTAVHIEVICQKLAEADPNMVHFLGLKESEKGLAREVWILNQKNEKLVYASSFLPLNSLDPSLHDALISRKHSIGDLIETMKLPSLRDQIGFGRINSKSLSEEFTSPDHSPLWYRHFRLSSPRHLLASIYEVFSPRVFEV
jgi:chorismate-pyruvate lyase